MDLAMAKRKSTTWTPAQIKALRRRLKLTQAQAAGKVGVGQAVWSAWESGVRKPSRQSRILLDILAEE